MRQLTVLYIGAPSEDAPLGDTYTKHYDNLIGYHFDPEEKTLVVVVRDGPANQRTITYPESKVIRTTFQQ